MKSERLCCCILGDSISQGVGKRRTNYTSQLEACSTGKIECNNMALTGTTISYVSKILPDISNAHPDLIVVMYGSVDAQIRANIWRNRCGLCNIIPARYRGGGMLEPRAVYSKKWYRWIPDRMDTVIRFFIKKYVLLTQGKVQWVSKDEFSLMYRETIKSLLEITPNLILSSTVYIDDRYFLNSSTEYESFNKVISELAEEFNLPFVDIYSQMKSCVHKEGWDSAFLKDHFHPNERGYSMIASKLWQAIEGNTQIKWDNF